ncbi:hypothetical protein LX16_3053 [Stackebrandtia albiflava]|uniref:Uncharacterized protein n=1 Tax=Stackebrandtia albiflava TaxID=406432 RepID=A0A562V3B6_9ACTN|nr:hypothetical protein [Stackebrandtia albiflava]TWJ12297.1 hypothetical protein LX16_3053 [Stackebrandtia albiflava]
MTLACGESLGFDDCEESALQHLDAPVYVNSLSLKNLHSGFEMLPAGGDAL